MGAEAEELEVLKKFADIAALGGIKGSLDEERRVFSAGFQLPEGRSQMVFARALPGAIQGQDGVCLYSACRRVKGGILGGLSKNDALELLKLNARVLIARYGVSELEDGYMIEASVDCLLETLDPDEVEAYFWSVAFAADNYEKKFGSDEF